LNPKIISVGYSVPANSYTQEEIFEALRYDRHYWPIFRDSGIEMRHFWVPLSRIRSLSWQEQQDAYRKGSVQLSKEAIVRCLDGRTPQDIACLTFSSCTGFLPGPTAAHYLGHELKLNPDTYYLNIGSMGCEGGFPGLKRASDFSTVTGKTSMAIACELASCSYFPEPDGKPDPENHFELARSNSIFADAAASVLVGFDDDPRHPEIIDTETYTDTEHLSDLGYTWRDGRLRVLLSRDVPKIAASLVYAVVDNILERNQLESIEHWIVHAAGVQVLDNIRDKLELPEEKLALSRKVLRTYGNCSSATIGIIGKMLMEDVEIHTGDYGLVISLGPGMTAGCTLLRW
jgi:predicted naringenin-chalcone synthase